MEGVNDNKIDQNEPQDNYAFKYNFVNTPWDDRSLRSKIGIVSLLLAIFTATMACVIHNLIMHFSSFQPKHAKADIKCNLVKVEEYKFVARIHSVKTQELLCVGAVLSSTSVLADGVCMKSGPIRLRIGSPFEPRCKKGFSVDIIEPVSHDGVVSKEMVLVSSYDNMADCAQRVIPLGDDLNWKSQAYIIGRPLRGGRSLSRQPANLVDVETINPNHSIKNLNLKNMICVIELGTCPVRAGDLLIQNGRLFGLASTSTHVKDQSKLACFADIRIILQVLKKLSPDIFQENKTK